MFTLAMNTSTISVQELRENMPAIIRRLKSGESFTLIHRSAPVATLGPISKGTPATYNAYKMFYNPPTQLLLKSRKSAQELIQQER
jgi:antitoxin (DNA-binding transcriptional repressor) of toxin-antitoxin stability system